LGESGTGKGLVARAIHENSHRSRRPFIVVNCATLPADLLESELFGHERGSFTGAYSQKTGKFEAAAGGTIFLDEIGELPLPLQPKLLRVLQERTFERVGGTLSIAADVRVVAATNRPLEEEVAAKNFRTDLFYRLNGFTIHLPPLRDRRADILPLAYYFLRRYADRNGTAMPILTEDAIHALEQHSFPGNVRELEHLTERLSVQTGGRAITGDHLESQLSAGFRQPGDDFDLKSLLELPFHQSVALWERRVIEHALDLSAGNKSEAARRLGMHRRLLYEKLQQLGMA
jgi:two-component system response regulator AtoC